MILTTRVAPRALSLVQPGRQMRLELDGGLESPYAENILREMDIGGKLGLKSASNERLVLARERTRGFPRALEALFAILSADRDTTLEEILTGTATPLPENVTEALVGEAFSRLDPTQQRVMQALAVYGRPVPPTAVDFLLHPHDPGVDSAPFLTRLVNMHFARKEAGRYYLHPVDREYALSRLAPGKVADRWADEREFTRYGLLHRSAEYFEQARLPRQNWKTIEDLAPQLAEFDLRFEGQDYETAGYLLHEISYDYLKLWGWSRLLVELNERLLGKLADSRLKSLILTSQAQACSHLGKLKESIAYQEKALAIQREQGDRRGEGVNLGDLGGCYRSLGQTVLAIEFHEKALAIEREVGDRRGEGVTLGNLGLCYSDLGQTARAIEYHEQALAIKREVGDRRGRGLPWATWAAVIGDLGQTARAIEYHEQALAVKREVGDRRGEGVTLGNLGSCYSDLGQIARAIEYHEQALAIKREVGDRRGEGIAFCSLGVCYGDLGQTTRAIENLEAALAVARGRQSTWGRLRTLSPGAVCR